MGDPTRGEVPLNGVRSPVPSDVGEKLLGVSAGELPPSPQEFINPATSPAALAAAGEDAAAAVSGVVFALSGVVGVLLLEVPRFRAALFAAAGAG